ncbi:MAG: replicative DNA helicase, partial [Nocardioidaceae bacterium]|nr:replicative DNA helicase [Nocardioidaceae bacterium]
MSVTQFPAAGAEPDGSDGWGSPAPGDRTPPQDNDAEQSVLGAMLLSKDAIADVIETVRGLDFYRPAHETLFDAILDLYGRGEPADAVTVAAELQRRGELTRVGGAPYLHTLVAGVPIAANANYYAEIVREKAILRRLVDVGTKIAQLGYGGQGQGDDVVDRAQAEVYGVTERRASEDFAPLSEIIPATLEEIEAIEGHDGTLVGVPTGFTDLDALTNGLHPGQMVIVAARPSAGKSTLALDLCRSASLRHGLASVIFSLEMNRTEITMRLLSAEAKIALHSMRNGKMNEDDWARLARRMAEVSEAPLFIDDSPNMTMMEIRAKARRLKQRHDLRLVVVDYLQLMTSGRRVESRQVEVSEFSRQMKLLAKELEVPVVAVSQLNRGAEQRTDKRPLLSDLRESGCLIASTRLLRADNGAEVTLGELLTEKSRDVSVWSLDDRLKLVPRTLTHAFPSGSKPTYRVRLASGREVDATANHPFLTLDGWTRLDRLAVADRVGVLRHAPAPLEVTRWSDDHVVRTARGAARHQGLPASVFGLPKRQVALFVRHLWAPYGSIDWD